MTENKVRFGLAEVAIAFKNETGYEKPERVPGAVSLTTSPEGDTEKFYADDGTFFTAVVNDGYTGDLEMSLIPDSLKAKMFNWPIDDNGALVEDADALPSEFALIFRIRGDQKKRYSVFYGVTAERPKGDHKTIEGKATPATETMSITMTPTTIGGMNVTKLSIEPNESNNDVIDGFYDNVYLPTFSNPEDNPDGD